MVNILASPFGYIIRYFYSICDDYLITLLLFALFVKLLLFPFTLLERKNSLNQKRIAPKIAAIQKKYTDINSEESAIAMKKELKEIYSGGKGSPFAGIFLSFIQIPIVIILYRVILNPLTFLCELSSDTITSLNNCMLTLTGSGGSQLEILNFVKNNYGLLSNIEEFKEVLPSPDILPNTSIFNGMMFLSDIPKNNMVSILALVPLLMFVTNILSSLISISLNSGIGSMKNLKGAKVIGLILPPLLITGFSFGLPVGISFYWIFQNIIGCFTNSLAHLLIPEKPNSTESINYCVEIPLPEEEVTSLSS